MTNVERTPLPSSLRDILEKQIFSSDSDEQMINIAGQPVSFHTDFRLVLSTSVPLCVRGICQLTTTVAAVNTAAAAAMLLILVLFLPTV